MPFPAVTVRAVEDLNPWGFVIKSLDLMALQCFDNSGRPLESSCNLSKKLREDFEFLLNEIVNKISVKLQNLRSRWDLTAVKAFPKKERLKAQAKDLEFVAIKLASTYLNNITDGKILFKKCKRIFARKIGMYESWKMKQFVNDYWKPLITEASSNINATIVEYCKTESKVCREHLITSYANLYLPFYVVKIPIAKLGFGQFLSFFSRLVTKNYFLSSAQRPTRYEKIIEKYLVSVYDHLSNRVERTFDISIYELVQLLHFPNNMNENMAYANYAMKKFGCSGNKKKSLGARWLNWIEHRVAHHRPCQILSSARRYGFGECCNATTQLQNQLEPILKVMKFAAQPPHFIETDEEMSLTFQNATFLGYPLQFPLKSSSSKLSFRITRDMFYGDGVVNYNPKIPICQYLGNPTNPMKTDCTLFSRSVTNEGLGYTFNGANFWSLYRETPYTEIFSKIMYPQGGQGLRGVSLRDDLMGTYTDAGVKLTESSGPSYGLTIALHAANLYNKKTENATFVTIKSPFKVIHHDSKFQLYYTTLNGIVF